MNSKETEIEAILLLLRPVSVMEQEAEQTTPEDPATFEFQEGDIAYGRGGWYAVRDDKGTWVGEWLRNHTGPPWQGKNIKLDDDDARSHARQGSAHFSIRHGTVLSEWINFKEEPWDCDE